MPSHMRPTQSKSTSRHPSGARFTPGPASQVEGAGPRRHRTTGHRPAHRWTPILLAIFIAVAAVAIIWRAVLPHLGIGADGFGGPTTGQQTSTLTSDGTTWDLASDLASPVELAGVSGDGVSIRFLPDPNFAFTTLHVVSCEVNGVAHDATSGTDPLRYTVVNESTGESVSTIDPYFITSGTGEGASGTVVIVKVEGLAADQYDSVVLALDETFAEGDITSGNYTTTDANGLSVTVNKAS